MTVIAFKDGVMAADTQITSFNHKNSAQKIVRLPDGGVAGGCGLWSTAYGVLKWLAEGGDVNDPALLARDRDWAPSVRDACILIARPDGSLWLLEEEFPAYPVMDPSAAVGCGADAVVMAMGRGMSAVDAVLAVTKQDVLCGEPVQSMELHETLEYPGVVTYKPRRGKKV